MVPAQSGPDALYAAAVVLWRERRRDEAIRLIDEALRRRPNFADALCMGGYMLSECGKPEPALRFYRRALELDASLVVAHLNAGKVLFSAGRFAEALGSFEAATALAPDNPDAWCSRAGALRELGRLEESLEAAQRALALRPDFPEAAINLGNALLKLDRCEEALDAYVRASRAAPCSAAALCGQALALRGLGRFSDALEAFEAAEALGGREARAGKGCLLLTLGDGGPRRKAHRHRLHANQSPLARGRLPHARRHVRPSAQRRIRRGLFESASGRGGHLDAGRGPLQRRAGQSRSGEDIRVPGHPQHDRERLWTVDAERALALPVARIGAIVSRGPLV
jgi:tetratricopeptide (TPR) repeat protein